MASVTGVIRELISGFEWFGTITSESADTESTFGFQHTDMVTVSGVNERKHFPVSAVAIEPCDECPESAVAL